MKLEKLVSSLAGIQIGIITLIAFRISFTSWIELIAVIFLFCFYFYTLWEVNNEVKKDKEHRDDLYELLEKRK